METKKYKFSKEKWHDFKIFEKVIKSETEHFVVSEKNGKEKKETEYHKYFDTYEEAAAYRLEFLNSIIEKHKAIIVYNKDCINVISKFINTFKSECNL